MQAAESMESIRAFEERMAFERACAARGGHPLSLVSLEVAEQAAPGPHAAPAFFGELKRSLRSTDVICRTEPRRLQILLPDTSPEDAERLSSLVASSEAVGQAARWEVVDLVEPDERDRRDAGRAERQTPIQAPTAAPSGPDLAIAPLGIFRLLARPLPRWRRALDVFETSLGLIVVSPLLLAIAIAIKVTSRGPVLFKQQRTGANLRRFPIYKFRTMRAGADKQLKELAHINEMSGPLFKSAADPRLTPIGGFLRRWSLDELPQLVNVLKGDMTVFGPRALSPLPSAYESWQLRRFTMTPGIACTWQAERRAEVDFDHWMRSDLEYVDRELSLRADLRLLVRVLSSVLKGSGAR